MNRREFLAAVAALSAVPGSTAEEVRHEPPYLALEKFIEPGNDEFPEEKAAMELRAKLHRELPTWNLGRIRRAEFYPLPDGLVRYEIASEGSYRVGYLKNGQRTDEHVVSSAEPYFRDVTVSAFQHAPSFEQQLAKGVPYWRARLDPASGIDIYGSNGVAVGDIDGDGRDEIYVCEPGGLPNRLYKFAADGTLSDVTEAWGVGLLDDTSSALFLDLRNTGYQDLVVLRSGGPLLFINEGKQFGLRQDAFRFATLPKGGFTGMAAADFDRDGKLDLYLCCYVYFQSEAQYTYAVPYHDAQNGPPNFLFRNRLNADGTGFLEDCTAETGMNENNDRFSFAPAWCDFNGDGWPDLYVANDFGRKNLYVNSNGHFRDGAAQAGVEDIGPGMSASWFDYDHDGKPDLYVANMWSDAGQRVVHDKNFLPAHGKAENEAYRRHTKGNSLYRNRGDGTFEDATFSQHAEFGRWAWSSGGHDFDNDGNAEIFVTCGMLTNTSKTDLMSFFWRQVVAKSPVTAAPSQAYQNGWNALNQFIREEYSWSGYEPNVLHVKGGDRYYDHSGVSGLDFADDSRAFAVMDFDGDGRPDIILKSRLGPQVRILQNNWAGTNESIAFQLTGTRSNRDAIGARIQVDHQTKWLEAGSGFLSQHSKRMIFGLGAGGTVEQVRITWPSGVGQAFENLQPGRIYFVLEGSQDLRSEAFRPHSRMPSKPVECTNELALDDTWFVEPVPLPDPKSGPGLFVLSEPTEQYEIFRRYLFDWRTSLQTPLAFLLNDDGHVIKVYAHVPSSKQVEEDLARRKDHAKLALPFPGDYIGQPRRDFFKFGVAFLWAGYPAQALPYLEEVLRRTPDNTRVIGLVARELVKQDRLDEARLRFEQLIKLKPDDADAINDLGTLYMQQGKANDAIAAFEYGIRVAPDEDILYLNLGRAFTRLGQIDRARQVMQRLLDRKPDNATAQHALQELGGR